MNLLTPTAQQGAVGNILHKRVLEQVSGVGRRTLLEQQTRPRQAVEGCIVAIWRNLPTGDFGDIIRLLILTGQRREEIGGLQWSEVDLAGGVINLPAARVKNNRPHQVPLSEPALAILAARQARANGEPAVFGRDGRDRFTNWSNTKSALDRRLPPMPAWRLHDARRSVATGMAELGIAPHIIEAVLNHVSGHKGGVAGILQSGQIHRRSAAGAGAMGGACCRPSRFDHQHWHDCQSGLGLAAD
jgi:integrase